MQQRHCAAPLKVGLVGCGEIAHAHARHILRADHRHKIVGVCDINPTKGHSFARRFKIDEVYTELDPFLEEQRPDVVHVLTPPQTHAHLASRVMEAGCHVLVEKPMAVSTEQADRMIAAADANDVKLCVNHNLLFDPVVMRAHAIVREGTIGELVCVDTHYGFNVAEASGQAWVDDLTGGILQNIAPHPLYLALEFIDDLIRVHVSASATGAQGRKHPDELRVIIEGNHVIGTVAISFRIKPNIHVLRLCGTRGILHVDLASKLLWVERLRSLPRVMARAVMNLEVGGHLAGGTITNAVRMLIGRFKSYQGLGTLVQHFYESIETGMPVPVSRESARRVVHVYDRITAQLAHSLAL